MYGIVVDSYGDVVDEVIELAEALLRRSVDVRDGEGECVQES